MLSPPILIPNGLPYDQSFESSIWSRKRSIPGPGNPNEFTIKELAIQVLSLTASQSRIKFSPLPLDDPKLRKPDITLAIESLKGWNPQVQLDLGLKKTINFFRALSSES